MKHSAINQVDVLGNIKKFSKNAIELAWTLGPVKAAGKSVLADWGFVSFNAWLTSEICNPKDPAKNLIARSYAYKLAAIGIVFWPIRNKVNQLVHEGKIGIAQLHTVANEVDAGRMTRNQANELVEQGLPLPEKTKEHKKADSDEIVIPYPFKIKKGDKVNFDIALKLYAVHNGLGSVNEAFNHWVLSELPNLQSLPLGRFEKFRDRVYAEGTQSFSCKLCGNIPTEPTMHHVLPKSIGLGYGPLVLLCMEPCHYQVVQPRWEFYARMWGFDPIALRDEAQDWLRMHKVDRDITKIAIGE